MPHQGRDKSTSFQLFPTGHLLLRISSVVSWGLEQMEWTGYSVQPLQQKSPPPSKLHYCIRFCTSGEKRQTLKYFVYFGSTCHLPRGAFHTCWCCFGGVVSWDSFAQAGKCPKCPRVAQIWLLLSWPGQWPRLRAVTSAGTSPPAAWGRLRLLELCADLRCCCSTPDMWEVQNKK